MSRRTPLTDTDIVNYLQANPRTVVSIAKMPDIQMAVIEQDLPENKNSQDLIDVLLKRYHEHDQDVKHFVEDLLRNPAKALALRK